MRFNPILFMFLMMSLGMPACSHTAKPDGLRFAGYIGDGDYAPSKPVMELLSEHALVTPGGHAYLYMKKGDGKQNPPRDAIADIHLSIKDAGDELINEDSTTVSLDESTPLIQDVVTHMVVGDKVRVWGDSYLRIWEIELLGFRLKPTEPNAGIAPGPGRVPETGARTERLKQTYGSKIQKDQFIHLQKTYWKPREDGGLELVVSYDYIAQVNPYVLFDYYYNLFLTMSVGDRVRTVWPQKNGYPDITVDVWIIDRYPQYETPKDLAVPEDKSLRLGAGIYKKMLYHREDAPKLDDKAFEISLNCWNTSTGALITTTDLDYFGKHSAVGGSIHTRENLRKWRDIVDFEMERPDPHSWCDSVEQYASSAQMCRQLRETDRTFTEMERRSAGNTGYRWKLSFAWQKILKDAAYGDVFMVWISNIAIHGGERAKDSMHHDHYLDLTCRVRIGAK